LQRHLAVIFELNAAPSSGHFVNFATLFSGLFWQLVAKGFRMKMFIKPEVLQYFAWKIIAKDWNELQFFILNV
jgi:hypothetical protein